MKAEELLRQGKLTEAVQALTGYLREAPGDSKARTFLFELLCFCGEYDRAEKHLDVLGEGTKEAALGALLYRAALHADRIRQQMFEKDEYPRPPGEEAAKITGTMNGNPFETLSDADPRIGPRLEVFAGGDYLWIPFQHVASLEMQAPKRLRDLLWIPARLITGPAFRDRDLGEVLLPVLSPLTYRHADPEVRLGRMTDWCTDESGRELVFGQKMLLVDGQEFPFLELRRLEISASQAPLGSHATQG